MNASYPCSLLSWLALSNCKAIHSRLGSSVFSGSGSSRGFCLSGNGVDAPSPPPRKVKILPLRFGHFFQLFLPSVLKLK
ncbi:hypothetical protein KY289_018274 [Solanum tuberosum]|nr:hypothetical protein KY289_018274 [Solanum tuberosum]